MAMLTMDVLGMCVVLRDGPDRAGAPYALGFLKDPGHLQTVQYQDADGGRLAALSFWGRGEIRFEGVKRGDVQLVDNFYDKAEKLEKRRLPFIHELLGEECQPRSLSDVTKACWAYIPLPGGTLTTLPAHVTDAVTWSFGVNSFVLTDRLRYTAAIDGRLKLGNKELPGDREAHVYLTIASVDRDYGSRRRQEVEPGLPLTEFALFYRCVTQGGPIPRCETAALDPDSPICPLLGVQY